jgi:hypothetical protein
MKLIYNVTIKIDITIASQWLAWMQEEHMPEVLSTGLFDQYELYELIEPEDTEGKTFVAQYHTNSVKRYEDYITLYAPRLREKGFEKFGNQFIAFRSVLQKV